MTPLPTATTLRIFSTHLLVALFSCVSLDTYSQETGSKQTSFPTTESTSAAPEMLHPKSEITLEPVIVKATRTNDQFPNSSRLSELDISSQRTGTSDSAHLLQNIPGVSLYSAGPVSSLPVIHGLADDRLRILVDGMDLMPACPNHMNSVLSYINPTQVGSVSAFAGITPVSLGGDSIGGAIQVKSSSPKFASAEEKVLIKGEAGYFFRSNGNARGYNTAGTLAGENVNITYNESRSQSDNYKAAANFKSKKWLKLNGLNKTAANEVASSSLKDSVNRDIGIALRYNDHLLQFNVSEQSIGFEGFPNQRMDMTANKNTLFNLRYTGQFEWGELEARLYEQDTKHKMDMDLDRVPELPAMPMDAAAKTRGAQIKASLDLSERDTLRVGSEYLAYRLDDWWPPLEGDFPSMCCEVFWNIRNGKRDRVSYFGEWEAQWNPKLLSLLGIRGDIVKANAGNAQGYSDSSLYTPDALAFNARDHKRTDHNVDWAALIRYTPDTMQTYEVGFARKSRSPNLHERYPWSNFAMAALMNNFVGDGNGYIGNPDLKPEVAHTFSGTIDWHSADKEIWGIKVTGYINMVDNFIDAKRCSSVLCDFETNVKKTKGFVLLQYENQSAQLYGIDLSGHRLLGQFDNFGSFTGSGVISYVIGENTTTGDNLYHIMPLNGKFSLEHRLGGWTTTAEIQTVAAKTHISQVRNEVPTPGYSLFNLRSSYEFKYARLDVSVENVFNKFYSLPLGGAYLGQGNQMRMNDGIWGTNIPGMGRSVNLALNIHF